MALISSESSLYADPWMCVISPFAHASQEPQCFLSPSNHHYLEGICWSLTSLAQQPTGRLSKAPLRPQMRGCS